MGWVTFVRRRVISGEGITWLPLALHPIIVERGLHICHVLHESHRHVTLNAKARDDVTPTAHEAPLILPVTCFSKRVWWKDEHIPCQVFLGVCMWLLFVFPPSTVIGLDRHALTRCRAGLDNTLRWAVYFRSWDSVHSFTPASANEKQLAADSNIKIYALLLYSYEYKLYEWNGTEVCFAFIMCIYFSVWCVHVSAHKWFFACGIECLPHWPSLVVCLGITASALGSSPLKGFMPPADPEDLCRFRLSVGPSQQPCCGSLTQPGMCYSSHVVMGCQKQPWQMLLFFSWNDRAGVTLQTTIIILCSALAKSVLRACSAIIQRQEDISFAKSMNYRTPNFMLFEIKLRKQQGRHECN